MTGSSASQQARLRQLWRDHFAHCARLAQAYHAASEAYIASRGRTPEPRYPLYPPFPEECRGLTCGAKTRSGTPCKRVDLVGAGRCKLHGGMSTGPRTPDGVARARANLARRWVRQNADP